MNLCVSFSILASEDDRPPFGAIVRLVVKKTHLTPLSRFPFLDFHQKQPALDHNEHLPRHLCRCVHCLN
ncbi:hypothetical protein PsorP6_002112 [Peronosclerospora sorghi]|uniref:Uncharacterized protein n=1 Tax=Peronosclerospora sorghi TaxID=230839 RepID=A0ACC0WY70_9STRA|nr:hypothetical protein PsorP6_002112 [Peronosclerospora sorghi]